jgi:aryl-alcohol dehydrogenase-like predicted oxidoreductase
MRRRSLGKSGIEVSELGLGTWGLSGDGYGPVAEVEQDRVIERALALGITLFETSTSYARGEMERRFGRLLPRDGVHIVTKLGTDRESVPERKRFDVAYLQRAFDESRERLRRDVVDIVLLHGPSLAAVQKGEATECLARWREAGHVRAWGVTVGSSEVGRASVERGAQVLSLPYNAFHSFDLRALGPLIQDEEVGILAHSVLCYGLLCGMWPPDKTFPAGDHRSERWTPDEMRYRIRQLDALRPTVRGEVTSMRSAALRYVLDSRLISTALLGPRSSLQLDQLVRDAGKSPPYLARDQRTALEARLREVRVEA